MSDSHIPLPERLRPRDLTQIIGQEHLLGEQAPLRQMIDQGHLPSIIFWGPPGVGKTTIALIRCRRSRLVEGADGVLWLFNADSDFCLHRPAATA